MKAGEVCMLVRLGGRQARFNGEFVRLIGLAAMPLRLDPIWHVEPLFALPENFATICGARYLHPIDPEGREVRDWSGLTSIWQPEKPAGISHQELRRRLAL